jgi:hypothetical protein
MGDSKTPHVATLRISAVQRGLCIAALSIAVIVCALFTADLILGLAGMYNLAPFKYANMIIDIVFIICSIALAIMSWFTLREQV